MIRKPEGIPYKAYVYRDDETHGEILEAGYIPVRTAWPPYEAIIYTPLWSYRIIFGKSETQNFLCIPVEYIGIRLSENIRDIAWNEVELYGAGINREDAARIAFGISKLADWIEEYKDDYSDDNVFFD